MCLCLLFLSANFNTCFVLLIFCTVTFYGASPCPAGHLLNFSLFSEIPVKPCFSGVVWEKQIERIWNNEVTELPCCTEDTEQNHLFLIP